MSEVVNRRLNIYIDETSALKALERLTEQERRLTLAIEKGTRAGKDMTKELAQLEKVKAQLQGIGQALEGQALPSLQMATSAVSALRKELKQLPPDTDLFKKKLEQLDGATSTLDQVKARVMGIRDAFKQTMQEAKTIALGVLVGNTVQSVVERTVSFIGGLFTGSGKISDELAAIEKATGMSTEEVRNLNSELSKIDTRTKNSDLRETAMALGQIGEAANKLNISSLDKVTVALADEFNSSAGDITKELSILRNNLRDIKSDNYGADILHIANALNVLGASGLATAPVVTDIANRVAGVGGTFNIQSGAILGTAATFQELGIAAERGSTAYIKILQRIAANPEPFAEVSGLQLQEFIDLVNNDLQAAFVRVSVGAKNAGKENVEFGRILHDLDADGSGAGEVLSKIAANADMLAEKTALATKALQETSSITEEFNKRNNTAGATADKLQKSLNRLFTSRTITEFFDSLTEAAFRFVQAITKLPEFVEENRYALLTLSAGILLLNKSYIAAALSVIADTAAKVANAVATRASATANAIAISAQAAYITITNLLTGSITAATAAQRLWNIVLNTGAGPIGAILVLVGSLVIGLRSLVKGTTELSAAEAARAEVQRRVIDATGDEVSKLQALSEVAKDQNVNYEGRTKALQDLIAISPEYLNSLTLENIQTAQGKKILDDYIGLLLRRAELEAAMAVRSEKSKQDTELLRIQTQVERKVSTGNTDFQDLSEEEQKFLKDGFFSARGFKGSVSIFDAIVGNDGFAGRALDAIKKARKNIADEIAITDETIRQRYESVTKSSEQKVTSATDTAGGDTIVRIGEIRARIKELDKALLDIATTDKKAIQLNRQERAALQKELKALMKPDAAGAGSHGNKATTDLAKDLKKISQDLALHDLPKISRAVEEVIFKYEELYKRAAGNTAQTAEVTRLFGRELEIVVSKFSIDPRNMKLAPVLETATEITTKLSAVAQKGISGIIDRANKEEKEKLLKHRNEIANLELTALIHRGRKRLDAQLALLEKEKEAERNAKLHTAEELELIEKQYQQRAEELTAAHNRRKWDTVIESLSTIAGAFSELNNTINSIQNAELEAERARNEERKSYYKTLLDEKIISQKEYDQAIANLDKQQQAKERKLRKEQFTRNQLVSVGQAIISTYEAATKALTAGPIIGPILAGIVTAMGLANVALIAGQKPSFGRGGFLSGPSHNSPYKGMPVSDPRDGKVVAYLEGGEGVANKNTMQDQTVYQVQGTPSQIISSLNAQGGGVSWTTGATIVPKWKSSPIRMMDMPAITRQIQEVRYYQLGGAFQVNPPVPGAKSTEQQELDQVTFKKFYEAMIRRLSEPLRAEIVYSDFELKAAQMERLRDQGMIS